MTRHILISAIFGSAVVGTAITGQHAQRSHDVGAMFQNRCMSCHIPPNPQLPADKAWLGQVRETA